MNIASIIISYKPDINDLWADVASLYQAVDVVYLWRNSSEELAIPVEFSEKLRVCGSGDNDFISKPLNTILRKCKEDGYEYLLTMDQDSKWLNFDHFLEEVQSDSDEKAVIYAPNVNNQYGADKGIIDVESVITSGSLLNVEAALTLGGFREDYKIYWVDGEFCYWARQNGYKIRLVTSGQMDQKFGKQTANRIGVVSYNYSKTSYYYLFKNMMLMHREFPGGCSTKCVLYTMKLYLSGLLFGNESGRFSKLGTVIKALCQGSFAKIDRRKPVVL